jgi:hypothetical protein
MRGSVAAFSASARSSSLPVASPRAWRILFWPCAASRVKWSPPLSRSNAAPHSMSWRTAPGPSSTRTRTASDRQRPSPASRVSWKWCSGVSPSASEAAIPPWAYSVLDSRSRSFVAIRTRQPASAASMAPRSPAMPEPKTRRSQESAGLAITGRPGARTGTPLRKLQPFPAAPTAWLLLPEGSFYRRGPDSAMSPAGLAAGKTKSGRAGAHPLCCFRRLEVTSPCGRVPS